jgi:hypothetical protein
MTRCPAKPKLSFSPHQASATGSPSFSSLAQAGVGAGAPELAALENFRGSAPAYRPVLVQSRRPLLPEPVHLLVGDAAQPGLKGACGVKAVALRPIKTGEVVFQESGELMHQPSMHSIQISETTHVNTRGEGRFLGHSFNPTCKIRIDELSSHPIDMVALRDIDENEALTFNYTTTEWDMASPFTDNETGRAVQGFKHLSDAQKLAALQANLVPAHILRLWLREIHSRLG